MVTNEKATNLNSNDANLLPDFLELLSFKPKVGRPNKRNFTASFYLKNPTP